MDQGGRVAVGMSRRCDTDPLSGLCHDGPARRHCQGPTGRVVAGLVADHGEAKPVGSSPYGDSCNRAFLAFSKFLLLVGHQRLVCHVESGKIFARVAFGSWASTRTRPRGFSPTPSGRGGTRKTTSSSPSAPTLVPVRWTAASTGSSLSRSPSVHPNRSGRRYST